MVCRLIRSVLRLIGNLLFLLGLLIIVLVVAYRCGGPAEVKRCLDRGGRWDEQAARCEAAGPGTARP